MFTLGHQDTQPWVEVREATVAFILCCWNHPGVTNVEDSLILFLNYHGSQVRELCEINKSNRLNGFFIPVGQIV